MSDAAKPLAPLRIGSVAVRRINNNNIYLDTAKDAAKVGSDAGSVFGSVKRSDY